MLASLGMHAVMLAVLVPLESVGRTSRPVHTATVLAATADLTTPPPPPEPEFEVPERPDDEAEVREDLVTPPEAPSPLADTWDDAQEDELRDRVHDTIFCPDPRASSSGRFRPARRPAAPAPPPVAQQPGDGFGTVPVTRPHAAPPPPASTPAAILTHVAPRYPRTARERGIEGIVTLRVVVLPDGSRGDITVTKSSGSALLDRAAIAAVKDWEFRPATVQGRPVRSTLDLPPIRFRLTD